MYCEWFRNFCYPTIPSITENRNVKVGLRNGNQECFSYCVHTKNSDAKLTRCNHITSMPLTVPQIAKFMEPIWGPPGSCRSCGYSLKSLQMTVENTKHFYSLGINCENLVSMTSIDEPLISALQMHRNCSTNKSSWNGGNSAKHDPKFIRPAKFHGEFTYEIWAQSHQHIMCILYLSFYFLFIYFCILVGTGDPEDRCAWWGQARNPPKGICINWSTACNW